MTKYTIQSTVDLTGMDTFGEGAWALANLDRLFVELHGNCCEQVCKQLVHPEESDTLQAAALKNREQDAAVTKQITDTLTITPVACDPERKESQ